MKVVELKSAVRDEMQAVRAASAGEHGTKAASDLGADLGIDVDVRCSCSNGIREHREGLNEVYCLSCSHGTTRYGRHINRLHDGFTRAGIPKRLRRLNGRSSATIRIRQEEGKQEAYAAARRFVLGLRQDDQGGTGLLILGPNGVGKSGLVVLVTQAIYRMGIGFLWTRWGSLVEDIRAQYGEPEQGARQLVAQRVPVLLLDDLGDPFRTRGDYQETENKRSILLDVLGYRHEMLKPTVMTANYASRGEMEEQLDPRITSRIYEMCHVVHMGGRDLRQANG